MRRVVTSSPDDDGCVNEAAPSAGGCQLQRWEIEAMRIRGPPLAKGIWSLGKGFETANSYSKKAESEMKVTSGGIAVLIATMVFSLAMPMGTLGQGRELIRGGGFEEGANAYWEQESTAGNLLLKQIPDAYSGNFVAQLGASGKSSDTLDQPVGALGAYAKELTITFYWRVENAKARSTDILYAEFVDANSGQVIPIGSLKASSGTRGWTQATYTYTPLELGLSPSTDYTLRFETELRSFSNPPVFDLDAVALTYEPLAGNAHAMLLPVDPPDPDLPPPVLDEDADMQYESTSGVTLTSNVHRDPPNDCPCNGSHQQITITVTGFTSLDTSAKVKFGTQGYTTMRTVTSFTVSGGGGTYQITCTIPDSPNKNVLGGATIKVKEYGKVAYSKPYAVDDSTGEQDGFYWGFPNPVSNIQLTSTHTPKVIGGEPMTVTATGMKAFQHWRSALNPPACGTRQPPTQNIDFDYPVVFTKDTSTPVIKVYAKRSTGNIDCSTGVYSATWSTDGAPAVCTSGTPCVATNTPMELDVLNPDNFSLDANGNPVAKHTYFKGTLPGALSFAPPTAAPSVTNAVPNYAYSVGPGGLVASCNGAPSTNTVQFQGTNVFRVLTVETLGSALPWTNLGSATAPYSVKGDASAYRSGSATVRFTTVDGLTSNLSGSGFSYNSSWKPVSSACPPSLTYSLNVAPGSYAYVDWWLLDTGLFESVNVSLTKIDGSSPSPLLNLTPDLLATDDQVYNVRAWRLMFTATTSAGIKTGDWIRYQAAVTASNIQIATAIITFQYTGP